MLHAKYQCIPANTWFMRRRFLKIYQNFLILPQKGPDPLFEQFESPSPQACFLLSLVEIGLVVLEKKIF